MKKIFYLILLLTVFSCNNKTQKGKFAVYVPTHHHMFTYYTDEINFVGNTIVFESIGHDNQTISIEKEDITSIQD